MKFIYFSEGVDARYPHACVVEVNLSTGEITESKTSYCPELAPLLPRLRALKLLQDELLTLLPVKRRRTGKKGAKP